MMKKSLDIKALLSSLNKKGIFLFLLSITGSYATHGSRLRDFNYRGTGYYILIKLLNSMHYVELRDIAAIYA